MRIRSVQAHLLSFVFPQPVELSFFGGTRQILKRDAMLIRVETENGLVGYGPGPGSEDASEQINGTIARWLVGRLLGDIDGPQGEEHDD